MEIEKLEKAKTQGNFTNKRIADLTGLSDSTISRIFSRQTEPKFSDMAKIAKVLNVSLDDLVGILRHESEEIRELRLKNKEQELTIQSQAAVILSHERELARADRGSEYLKKIVRVLAIAVAVMVVGVMTVLVYDVLNGDIGWARYEAYYHGTGSLTEVLEYIADIFKT